MALWGLIVRRFSPVVAIMLSAFYLRGACGSQLVVRGIGHNLPNLASVVRRGW